MSATAITTGKPVAERHPPALPLLFFTEMWERFSYYGMRALLVLYLVNSLGYERKDALTLYGIYTGLVYLTPIIGGFLADRYLGYRKSILIGGLVMALGHFAMAFPPLLHVALGLIIIGNGFFKPNIATILGKLYRENDARRDGGYTYFYMGVNLGAFFAPLIAGTLGETVGWHWGFAAAGIGMLLGLVQFLWGQNKLGDVGLPQGKSKLDGRDWIEIIGISLLMIPLIYLMMAIWGFVGPLWGALPAAVRIGLPIVAFATFLFRTKQTCTKTEFDQVLAIVIMGVFVIFFWMGFEQAGGTMNLFADKQTDRHFLGWEIPASVFQAINPVFIVLLGPLLATIWARIDNSRNPIPTPAKMAIGMIILGLGFIVLAIAQSRAETLGSVGPFWLVAVYLLHTVGELCLSPVGLSMVSKLAPLRLAAMMMGVWYLANTVANYLAGVLESLLEGSGVPIYIFLVGSSIGAGIVLLLITPWLKKLMHGKG